MKHPRSALNSQLAGSATEPWLPSRDTTVLLLSGSAPLQGAIGRVSAAAAVELVVAERPEQSAGGWGDLAAVLIDAAVASDPRAEAALTGWGGPTVMVGFAGESVQVWRQAERLGVDRVAILPDSGPWLANYLGRLRNPTSRAGVVAVVGGCGGAGASTLAVLVAAGAARQGVPTLLVDGDPWGGGLCTLLTAQDIPGVRWPQVLRASGTINPEQLAAALPHLGGLGLLSWNSGPTQTISEAPVGEDSLDVATFDDSTLGAAAEVMRAAKGAYGLVVVDLGRTSEALRALAPHCQGVLVVLPAQPRAVAAALQISEALPPKPLAAVVAGPLREGLDAAMVAASLGMPLVAKMPRLRGVAEALDSQRLPELLRRRPVRTLVANILEWMAGESSAPSGLPNSRPDLVRTRP